ncbi:putative RNA recognition motif domain, nucleotide-binding alpha-beta plait domain superfamily [Helianthus anomalus]
MEPIKSNYLSNESQPSDLAEIKSWPFKLTKITVKAAVSGGFGVSLLFWQLQLQSHPRSTNQLLLPTFYQSTASSHVLQINSSFPYLICKFSMRTLHNSVQRNLPASFEHSSLFFQFQGSEQDFHWGISQRDYHSLVDVVIIFFTNPFEKKSDLFVFGCVDTFVKYFGKSGEITDSVIMKDRLTDRPRGFGFITYADPSVVDIVIAETHVISGKQVKIKRTILKCSAESKDFKTKKIFVGGIPAAVTEG